MSSKTSDTIASISPKYGYLRNNFMQNDINFVTKYFCNCFFLLVTVGHWCLANILVVININILVPRKHFDNRLDYFRFV